MVDRWYLWKGFHAFLGLIGEGAYAPLGVSDRVMFLGPPSREDECWISCEFLNIYRFYDSVRSWRRSLVSEKRKFMLHTLSNAFEQASSILKKMCRLTVNLIQVLLEVSGQTSLKEITDAEEQIHRESYRYDVEAG